MGIMIGSNGQERQIIQIKDVDETVKGTISISKPKSSRTKKKKRLNYNYKKVSRQIMMSKSSSSSRRVVNKALQEVVALLRKQKNGDYDENELRHAIIHARKMERIARKKMKHLREEERAKQSGECMVERPEETNDRKKLEENMDGRPSKEELEEMLAEYEEMMREMEKENGLDEIMKEYMGASKEELTPEGLEKLRKKHRSDELKEIVEADMKYLQALFNRLDKEKQEAASGGVSLELEGMEIPVQISEVPVAEVEGAAVDVSL